MMLRTRRTYQQNIRRCYSGTGTKTIPLAFTLHKPKELDGDGQKDRPIIFMHGLFSSRKNNRSMSRVLARDLNRSVYAVDLRNHGESDHHERHDYVALADDVEAFIHEHGLHNPTLIGHSMGAKTALTLALQSPKLIRDVIAIDNGPISLPLLQDFHDYAKAMKTIEQARVKTVKEAERILANFESSPAIRLFLLTNLIESPDTSYLKFRVPVSTLASSFGHLGEFPFRDPRKASFEKPLLVIRAMQSHYIPDHALPLIKEFFPLSEVEEIDCGHWVVTEKPDDFRRAAVKFLRNKH